MKPILELSRKATTILLSILMLTSTAAIVGTAFHPANAASPSAPTFTNYELAGNPFIHGFSVGVTCPNSARTCQNTEGEPAIRADPSGNFYGSSENVFCVIGGLCGGTFAWKSTDNGNHFTTLPLPDSVSSGSVGFSPAGGDTDIAVAPVLNTNGHYNIYVASLATAPPLANVYVSTSHDGGASFNLNPTGATIPVDDREWIAADGANKVCVSYHAYATTNNLFVTCSYDGGTTFAQVANAFDVNHPWHAAYQNEIGNLALDPNNHLIYQSFSSIANAGELSCLSCSTHAVWIAVSIDGGLSFTDYPVYVNPNTAVGYGHQFVNVSVDQAGNVYLVYTDDHNMFYSFSTTFGQTWSGPYPRQQVHPEHSLGNNPLRWCMRIRRHMHRQQGPSRRLRNSSQPDNRIGRHHLYQRPIHEHRTRASYHPDQRQRGLHPIPQQQRRLLPHGHCSPNRRLNAPNYETPRQGQHRL